MAAQSVPSASSHRSSGFKPSTVVCGAIGFAKVLQKQALPSATFRIASAQEGHVTLVHETPSSLELTDYLHQPGD